MTMRIFLVLLAWALSAPATAQPLSISASVAVTWLNPISAPADHVGENPPSLGIVSHPALVVLWRGQPGWTFRGDTGPLAAVSFESSSGTTSDGERHHAIAVIHGGIRLDLEYGSHGRTARVNGVAVLLPEEHDVILLDNVDVELEAARTLSLGGEASEPVETFLGRSPEIREFMRCDLPLPEDVFLVNEADPEIAGQLREYVQTSLDERCLLLLGEYDEGGRPGLWIGRSSRVRPRRTAHQASETDSGLGAAERDPQQQGGGRRADHACHPVLVTGLDRASATQTGGRTMTGTHRPRRWASQGVAGLLAVGTLWMAWPLPAAAQTRNRLELQFGMGLAGDVIGQENPFEILYGTWDVGATLWLTGHWGVGVRQWRQVGRAAPDTARFSPARDDAPPFAVTGVAITGPAYDETIAQVFVRRRWFLADTELDLGVSVLKRWSQGFSKLLLPDDREPHGTVSERRGTLPEEWGGPRPVFLDLLVGRKVSRRLGVKAGVTTRQNLRPVNWLVLGVVSFGKHS